MRYLLQFVIIASAALIIMGQTALDDSGTRGEEVFNTVCATCHSMDPPMKLAPPMRMVIKHYLDAELEDPWGSLRAWVAAPDSSRSVLPAHAIEKFGLMPPLVLPEEDLDALIDYLKVQAEVEPAGQGMGMGNGMKNGMGNGNGNGNGNGMKNGMGNGMRH